MKCIQLWTLFVNTLQKEVRSKSFLFMTIMTILIVLGVNGMMDFFINNYGDQLPIGDMGNKKLIVFYTIISFWSSILANYIGIGCVESDFSSRVADQILAFPIKKVEYLLARVSGSLALVFLYYFISLALALIIFSLGSSSTEGMDALPILGSLVINSFKMLTIITLGILLSLFMPKIVSFLSLFFLTSCMGLANSYFMGDDFFFGEQFSRGILVGIGGLLNMLLPRIGVVSTLAQDVLNEGPISINLAFESLHFVGSYAAIFLLLVFIFRRKNLNY